MLDQLFQDVRYAFRTLKNAPLFTMVALLSLAIGIGANTAMFSVVDAVLLRPMPFPHPDELVVLQSENAKRGVTLSIMSAPEIQDYRREKSVFASLAAYRTGTGFLTESGSERVDIHSVDEYFFSTLQLQPMLGRTFRSEDLQPGAPPVAILNHGFWQRRFGGDPGIVGRSIRIGDAPFTIVGVMPEGAEQPGNVKTDIWKPLVITPQQLGNRGIRFISVVARLEPGLSIIKAQEHMTAVSSGMAEAYPEDHRGWSLRLTGLHESVVGDRKLPLLVLFGAVFAVLLIASTNVASLMSSRGSARRSEIAVRAALGASRRRVIQQILVESSLLSLLGGAAGIAVARVVLNAFLALVPPGLPRIETVGIDGKVMLFAFSLIVITSIVFGWLPAREASRTDPNRWLGAGRGNSDSGKSKARAALVVIEVAATLILVTGAALLLHSFARLQSVNMGLDAENVVTFSISGPPSSSARQAEFLETLLSRLQSVPNVQAAALSAVVPLRGFMMITPVWIEGVTEFSQQSEDMAAFNFVTPDYFRVFGIPVLKGRAFSPDDLMGNQRVLVVNESLARRFFNGNPIGRRVKIPDQQTEAYAEIVGVVGDFHQSSPGTPVRLEMYVPAGQRSDPGRFAAVRTSGDSAPLMSSLPGLVRSIDDKVVIDQLATVPQLLSKSVAEERFRTLLVSTYSALAVLLSVIGVYSVVAYSITRRRREIGIRMAIGGPNRQILGMLLWQGFAPCLIGIALGFGGSIVVARSIQSLLFGISAMDPLTFASSVAVVAFAGLCACGVPALRALRVDPLITLRCE